jgi:endoglucanase
LRGKRVHVHTARGPVPGVIGAVPPWIEDKQGNGNKNKNPEIHECWIDIGASSGASVARRVSVGDPVTFVEGFEMLNAHVGVARAYDDRIGAWTAAEALRLASRRDLKCAVYAASTVQEETGCHGAKMIAHSERPDAAIVLEVAHATDTPGINPKKMGPLRQRPRGGRAGRRARGPGAGGRRLFDHGPDT